MLKFGMRIRYDFIGETEFGFTLKMTNPFPDLIIVIVNYNLKNDTIELIHSLQKADADLGQIILVDNHSTDGSVEAVTAEFGSTINIIEAESNKGYPYGLNLGVSQGLKMGARWFLLMNNDTVVARTFLKELNKVTIENPEYSLIGPLILYYGQPDIIWYMGYRLIPGTLIGVGSFRGRKVRRNFPDVIPIVYLHGCTMMVKSDVFSKIGLFDAENLIYGDDADFSWRARLAGFKAAAAPHAQIWHKIASTMGRKKPRTEYLRIRNTIFFYLRYTNIFQRIIMILFTFVRTLWLIIKSLVKGQFELVLPMIYGWLDGWTKRTEARY